MGRVIRARAPSLACKLRARLAAPRLGAPGSCPLRETSPSAPYPARKWELREPRGTPACRLFFPPFLHVEKACTSSGSLISLGLPGSEGTLSPREPLLLPAAFFPMAFTSPRGAAGKFPGSESGWADLGSSLEGWGARCADSPQRIMKPVYFRERKRAMRLAGRDPFRTWVRGPLEYWWTVLLPKLEKQEFFGRR